jgi:hypothetical protein
MGRQRRIETRGKGFVLDAVELRQAVEATPLDEGGIDARFGHAGGSFWQITVRRI